MEAQERVERIERELQTLVAQKKQFKWIALGAAVLSPMLMLVEHWYVVFGLIFAVGFYLAGSYIGQLNVMETEERLGKARSKTRQL